MLSGQLVAQAISVVTRLGIPDRVAGRPRSVRMLARLTRTHPDALYRTLRALASAGIFAELPRRSFGATALSDVLRTGVPDSLRPVAILAGEQWRRAIYDLGRSVKTGRSAFAREHGVPFYAYLARHPDRFQLFTEVMGYKWTRLTATILRAWDFSHARTVVDVGGGSGALVEAILRASPETRAIVFDLPGTTALAKRRLAAAGLTRRGRVIAGDFFRGVPRGGDAYVLAFVLHNWDDARAITILRRCRAVLSNRAKLLIVEMPVPPDAKPSAAKIHDLEMLVFAPGGRERTLAEYRALLASAGLRLRRVLRTGTPVAVLEAVGLVRAPGSWRHASGDGQRIGGGTNGGAGGGHRDLRGRGIASVRRGRRG
jgi:ubiquinone/menaquinone biosynthesis C-methylase UbiE